MTVLEYAAHLVRVESHCALARAAMLLRDEPLSLKHLLQARTILTTLSAAIVSGDETHLHVAR